MEEGQARLPYEGVDPGRAWVDTGVDPVPVYVSSVSFPFVLQR